MLFWWFLRDAIYQIVDANIPRQWGVPIIVFDVLPTTTDEVEYNNPGVNAIFVNVEKTR